MIRLAQLKPPQADFGGDPNGVMQLQGSYHGEAAMRSQFLPLEAMGAGYPEAVI
jgi:hypothetical protein